MSNKTERKLLILYLGGFVLLAATIALFQPHVDTPPLYGNPPDEHARFLIPWYICQNGVIPTGFEEEVRIPAYGFSYALYNAFPYIVQGFVMRFASIFTDSVLILLYVARFVNVATGTCMAYVVYLLSRRLFQEQGMRWMFCFGIMFLPQNLFLHTYVNTDSMCLLSTAMMVYGLVSAYSDGFGRRSCLWMSGGIILCALSYYNAYGFILSCILLFLAYFLEYREGRWSYDWKQMLRKGIFISALVLAGIGWWFVRSFLLYDGDFLGLATREEMAIQYAIPEVNPLTMPTYENKGYTVWEMMEENHFIQGAFYSFVAAFGSMSILGNVWMYRIYLLFFAVGLVSCILFRAPGGNGSQKSRFHSVFHHANMIFCILMPLFLMIYYAYTMDYQNQGRYLMPAIVPLMYYVVRGLEKLVAQNFVPAWLKRMGVILAILLPIVCSIWMTFHAALPIYLETGVVLE